MLTLDALSKILCQSRTSVVISLNFPSTKMAKFRDGTYLGQKTSASRKFWADTQADVLIVLRQVCQLRNLVHFFLDSEMGTKRRD